MYQLERFEEHESLKEDFQKWFDDTSANWTNPWLFCNALSTYKDNTEFNRSFGDYLLSTSFIDLLKKAASKQLGYEVTCTGHAVELWLNVYEHNFFQEPHDHINPNDDEPPPDLCFNYFFEVPDEPLFFFLKGNEQHYIKEQSGTVAFFDANQYHGVDMNPENKPRKTVSGNLWIVKNDD